MSDRIDNITYKNLQIPSIYTGFSISKEAYERDGDGNIIQPSPVVNAIDINWGGAELDGLDSLDTTSQLLQYISDIHENGGGPGTYPVINNDSIVGIMLSAIRALQAEVVKLRNSFKYGVTSYKDDKTLMSDVIREYHDIDEDEPLWATDESELSAIDGYNFEDPREFAYTGNVLNGEDEYVQIIGEGIWEDTDDKLKEIIDPKIYCYLTTDSLNFTVRLKTINYDSENKIDETNVTYKDIDFSNFGIRPSDTGKYNILIVLGRKQLNNKALYGDNFIWIGIAHYLSSTMIKNGYLSGDSIVATPTYINDRYVFNKITFNDLVLSKLDFYSKYSDFTNRVQESTPSDEKYKYEAAHITIRSVSTYNILKDIKDQLLDDELIYVRDSGKLYIITDNTIKNISVGGDPDPEGGDDNPINPEHMTKEEILEKLIELNLITINDDNDYYQLNDIEAINFVNTETGKKFQFTVDAYGDLRSTEYDTSKSLDNFLKSLEIVHENEDGTTIVDRSRIEASIEYTNIESGTTDERDTTIKDCRGFVAHLHNTLDKTPKGASASWGINADRVKIGSIYAPKSTDSVISCSHAFVELENTSDKDFYLDGCYLHYSRPSADGTYIVSHLALKGYIPKNGTYLIRAKQYRDFDDPNVFIKVESFDQEWYEYVQTDDYEGYELVDLTLTIPIGVADNETNKSHYSFALTYGHANLLDTETLAVQWRQLYSDPEHKNTVSIAKSDFPYMFTWDFIDAVAINNRNNWTAEGTKKAANGYYAMKANSIYKTTFELDPAKQAYCSLNKKDSSRSRYQNVSDLQTVELTQGYITFPKSTEFKKFVSDYTPKASFEHKNVQTDKTHPNRNKPNAVTVSFGTDVYTTRCFNWVSCGTFDEYVFLYKNGSFVKKIESYKKISEAITEETTYPHRKEFPVNVNNIVYADLNNIRLSGIFPAEGSRYTSHKCIIKICDTAPETPETWTYIVGRADENGNPDPEHSSQEMHFTMYPETYKAKIYHTTDQQGFHWIEYQVWAAAAKKLNDLITTDCANEQIMPILINTGDMTQSGARVSEWLDYYNAGISLFDHLEQMNIVGNNDLAPYDITQIGTGDDPDKSNAYYYNLFYCYEVNPIYLYEYYEEDDEIPTGKKIGDIKGHNLENPIYPIANNKYIPSFYYIDIQNLRLLFLNSEITPITCEKWFKLTTADGKVGNLYTGYTTTGNVTATEVTSTYVADSIGYTPLYTILYHMTEDTSKKYIAICHEMPFTVITRDSLYYTGADTDKEISVARSISSGNKLVGSHMNQLSENDLGYGIYWFSRLLEYRGIKLCLGGHKHTYCLTYPVSENYIYKKEVNGELKDCWSYTDGPCPMAETLNTDIERSVSWKWGASTDTFPQPEYCKQIWNLSRDQGTTNLIFTPHHSKLPLVYITEEEKNYRYSSNFENVNEKYIIERDQAKTGDNTYKDIFLPCHIVTNKRGMSPVMYFMCQATGYKLTSNKELPTPKQRFSVLVPETTLDGSSDSPNANQRSPMYATLTFGMNASDSTKYEKFNLKLIRIRGIFNETNTTAVAGPDKFNFTQQAYGKKTINLQYVSLPEIHNGDAFNTSYNYGRWSNEVNTLIAESAL